MRFTSNMSVFTKTTKANKALINERVRQMLDGFKAADALKYNYAGLTTRLRNELTTFLLQHGTTVADHDTEDRLFPTDADPWLTGFSPFEMSAVVTTDAYMGFPYRPAWNRATGTFGLEVTIRDKASILPVLTTLATNGRPITHVKYEAVLIQIVNGAPQTKRKVFREINVAEWPDNPTPDTVTINGVPGSSSMAMLLVGARTYFAGSGGKLSKASFRTRDALVIATLDGSPV